MFISFIRTIVLYIIVIIALRIMGKRQIGELQPSEFVVAIMISELAAIPMQSTGTPLINGIIPIITLMAAEVTVSFVSMKNRGIRSFISGTPSILVRNGQIDIEEMKKLRFSLDDLIKELRVNNCPNISDVELAMLETNGKISILQKPEKHTATLSDLGIQPNPSGCTNVVISDGIIDHKVLHMAGYDEVWLKNKLKEFNIDSFEKIFIAVVDGLGNFSFQINQDK